MMRDRGGGADPAASEALAGPTARDAVSRAARGGSPLAAGTVAGGTSAASGSPAPEGVREGSLGAPTRHPIDWRNPEFYDEEALYGELERVFDVCHGCRRCVSLCNAFPTLFDLVDESATMEVDGVNRSDYGKVVDECYLCDLCFMTKCPYVPPHEWNVDFPHLMLRAKAVKYRRGEVKARDRLITRTDLIGRFASLPVVVDVANAATRSKPVRAVMDKVAGIHREANLPPYDSKSIRRRLRGAAADSGAVRVSSEAGPAAGGSGSESEEEAMPTAFACATPPAVETRAGAARSRRFRRPVRSPGSAPAARWRCSAPAMETGTSPTSGRTSRPFSQHNGIPVRLVPKERCCAMPRLELGDLPTVEKAKDANVEVLAKLVEEGFDVVAPVPSCVLMFKQELPLMFPEDERVAKVKGAIPRPFRVPRASPPRGAAPHRLPAFPGHGGLSRGLPPAVQNVGSKTREVLDLVPDTRVTVIERCSGHDGTYAVKRESYPHSMRIVRPVARRVRDEAPDHFGSDCPMAGNHIAHGLGEGRPAEHPLTLLRMAYGI